MMARTCRRAEPPYPQVGELGSPHMARNCAQAIDPCALCSCSIGRHSTNVTYIFSHAGGSIPYLAARFAFIDEMGFIAGAEQRGTAADMFRRMYWATALAASDPVLRMLRDVAGINQVLYGTDFPY
jgi:hypothetical protein